MSFASFNSRRYSNISRGSDRRESIMSLMSLADCSIGVNDDTLDIRENNDRSSNENDIKNDIKNDSNRNAPLPTTVMSYPSNLPTQQIVGDKKIDNFQNGITDINSFPSTLKIEEHKHFV